MATDRVTVRAFRADEWREYRALRLRALAEAPDAFMTTLADAAARPDDAWQARLAGAEHGKELPLVAERGGQPAGLCWGALDADDPTLAHLYQMWVAPEHRGAGVGRALLARAIEWARARGARRMVLDVTCGDTPARRLYDAAGFIPAAPPEAIRPGSDVMVQPMRLDLGGE